MVHTELRSKASIGYTSQSCGGTPTRKVLPELPLPNSGPGMRALSPTVALPARSVEPDWSLERDHGEAHDVKQSPHPKNQLGCERMRLAGARTLRDTAAANPSTPIWRKSTETRCTLPPLIGRGVTSRPAVVAEVIVRHPLGPVLLTEYGRRPRGVMQLAPRCRRSEPLHDVSPRTGRAASVGWLLIRRI
jgi:hypothetical protein